MSAEGTQAVKLKRGDRFEHKFWKNPITGDPTICHVTATRGGWAYWHQLGSSSSQCFEVKDAAKYVGRMLPGLPKP
jgi:hypothetical protein